MTDLSSALTCSASHSPSAMWCRTISCILSVPYMRSTNHRSSARKRLHMAAHTAHSIWQCQRHTCAGQAIGPAPAHAAHSTEHTAVQVPYKRGTCQANGGACDTTSPSTQEPASQKPLAATSSKRMCLAHHSKVQHVCCKQHDM